MNLMLAQERGALIDYIAEERADGMEPVSRNGERRYWTNLLAPQSDAEVLNCFLDLYDVDPSEHIVDLMVACIIMRSIYDLHHSVD